MQSASQGWAIGARVLLRYQNRVWEEVPLPQDDIGFYTMSMLNAEEGWMMSNKGPIHYKNGEWKISNDLLVRDKFSAMLMLNENEGWAVGDGILHYTNK